MHPDPTIGENGLTHIYRVDERTRRAVNFFLVAIGALPFSMSVLYWGQLLPHRGSLGGLLCIDLFFGGLVIFLGSAYSKRVILREDSIEVAGWFYSRELTFAEIRGRQTTASARLPYGYGYIFVPTDNNKRKLALPSLLRTDQFFRDWIKTIPKIPR